ncbi:MAG: cache and HAMP domain-containing protein, partial [Paracoccaceae bacterium]|nr:cache and HAMP domain-containing protein [Paracoccaceae bacterium]
MVMATMVAVNIAALSVASYHSTRSIVVEKAYAKLREIGEVRSQQLGELLQRIDEGLLAQSRDPAVADAILNFTKAFGTLVAPQEELQRAYIIENAFPIGKKDQLAGSDANTTYDFVHRRFHPMFSTLKNSMGYYDVLLFDTEGNLVYSVYKELDFATNLVTGEWNESGLGVVFQAANKLAAGDAAAFDDFAPYGPSGDAPAAFIARPVFASDGERLGVIAYQIPISEMNRASSTRMGATGHTFLVGSDGIYRSDSALTDGDDVLTNSVAQALVNQVEQRAEGHVTYENSDRQTMVGFVHPIDFNGASWAMVSEIGQAEMFAELPGLIQLQAMIGAAVLIFAIACTYLLSRGVSRPLDRVANGVKRVAAKKYNTQITDTERGDEIGDIAKSLESFRIALSEAEEDAVDAAFKGAAFEATGGPMLLCGLDFKITGTNQALLQLINENISDFSFTDEKIDGDTLTGRHLSELNLLPKDIEAAMTDHPSLPIKRKLRVGGTFLGLLID